MAAYDLAALWEAHCRYEFETRDVAATMSTMVAEPYVNHIPTMTGGVGFESLRHFYAHHFIGVNPPDFELLPSAVQSGRVPLSTSSSSASRTPLGWTGCCPAFCPPDVPWRFRRWPLCNFRKTNSCMGTSTGTKPACSFNSVCSIPTAFPSLGPRPRAKCLTFPCPSTH